MFPLVFVWCIIQFNILSPTRIGCDGSCSITDTERPHRTLQPVISQLGRVHVTFTSPFQVSQRCYDRIPSNNRVREIPIATACSVVCLRMHGSIRSFIIHVHTCISHMFILFRCDLPSLIYEGSGQPWNGAHLACLAMGVSLMHCRRDVKRGRDAVEEFVALIAVLLLC